MSNKRPLETDIYSDKKKRLPSSGYETDEQDIEIELNDVEMEEITELLKNSEKPDSRRQALRAWPKEEENVQPIVQQDSNSKASTSANLKNVTTSKHVPKKT